MPVYTKLVSIQKELNAPKGQYNKFGGYPYRSCEDIVEAVKPLMAKHGVFLNMSDEIVNIGDRFYVKAIVKLYDAEDESFIQATAFAREEETKKGMDGSQITGSASSYARKYALNGLFAIDDNKDADSNENAQETQNKAAQKQAQKQPPKAAPKAAPKQAELPACKYLEPESPFKCIVCGRGLNKDFAQKGLEKNGFIVCSGTHKEAYLASNGGANNA